MSHQDSFLLDEIEPEVGERINASWRAAFAKYGELVMIGSAPTLLAMASTEAFAAEGLPQQVVDVLNYALSLEYFEATFYKMANGTEGLIPAKYQGLFREIGQHESAHVALLSGVLGSAAVKAPKFDFTAGGKYPDVFSNFRDVFNALIDDRGYGRRRVQGAARKSRWYNRPSDRATDSLGRGAARGLRPRARWQARLGRRFRQTNDQERGSGSRQAVLRLGHPL